MDYRIEKKEAFKVAVKARKFGENSTAEIPAFWSEYFVQGLAGAVAPWMGVCGEVDEATKEFRYGIGCPVEKLGEAGAPDGFEEWTIPANTWAMFKCVGAMPLAIQDMWKRIYGEWLPQSKYEIAQSYDIEYYTDGDNASPDYVSEIWIPVKEK